LKYLTLQQVLLIHSRSIKRFGGGSGIRDIGLIESAVARPQASFDGQDLYKNIFDKLQRFFNRCLKIMPSLMEIKEPRSPLPVYS